MKITINQIQWHDAKILELALISSQDSFDRLSLKLESEAFIDDYGKEQIALLASDCYKIKVDLNLWVKGRDSIAKVSIKSESPWIVEEKQRFIGGFGPKELFHFEIITNTNSKIEALFTREDCLELVE